MTHNTREVDEKSDCELYDHIPVPYDVAFWHCKVCGKEMYFDTIESLETRHHQLQKAREGWEQQQIEYERKLSEYYNLIHAVESKFEGETRYQTALRYIQQAEQIPLEAYHSELDQDNK